MSQNRSTAVMQRRLEPHNSLDDFPTPPWATRALCEWLKGSGENIKTMTCREPAANRGFMVNPLREYFGTVLASDIHDYGFGFDIEDYLFPGAERSADWTITNPPFRLAEQFVATALNSSKRGVAVIVRSAFLEGVGRFERLFSKQPPSDILQFCERVPMVKGRYDPTASSATSYSWLIWRTYSKDSTCFHWISPCRKKLERREDYA